MTDPIATANAFADAYPDLPKRSIPDLPLAWEPTPQGGWDAMHEGYRLCIQPGAAARWHVWTPGLRLAAYGTGPSAKAEAEAALLRILRGAA